MGTTSMRRARSLAVAGASAAFVAGCGDRSPFVAKTWTADPPVERLLARYERALNDADAGAVCNLYADPSSRCYAVWHNRIRKASLPVRLSLRKITGGCAGDERVTFVERTRLSRRLHTMTVSEDERNYAWILDVGVGNRPSSLVVPAHGDCSNVGHDYAGSPSHDPAGRGEGNGS